MEVRDIWHAPYWNRNSSNLSSYAILRIIWILDIPSHIGRTNMSNSNLLNFDDVRVRGPLEFYAGKAHRFL